MLAGKDYELKKLSASRNAIFGFLGWVVPLGFTIALTPFIVHGLGPESYGLYMLVMGMIGYLISLNFNVGRALTKYVSAFQTKQQTDQISEVLSSTLGLYMLIGIVTAGCMLLLSSWLIVHVFDIAPALQPVAKRLMIWAAVGLVFTFLSQVFGSVPQALQRFDLYALIITMSGVATILGNALIVWLRLGVTTMVAWVAIVITMASLAFMLLSRCLMPGVHLTRHVRRPLLFELLRFSGAVTAYQVFGNLLSLFERGWLTRRLGTEAVTYYAVPMNIAIYIHSFISSLTLVIFPVISEANELGDNVRLERIYTRAYKYVSLLVVFAVVTFVVSGQRLLSHWMGMDFAAKTAGVLLPQSVWAGIVAMGIIPWQMADGLGFPKWNAFLAFFWLVVSALLSIGLTSRLGILAPAWGRLIAVLSVPFYTLFVERRVFGRCLYRFWRKVVLSLLMAGGAAAALQYSVLNGRLFAGWLGLLAGTVSSGLLYISILWMGGYIDHSEKIRLKNVIARIVAPFTIGLVK